MVRSTGSWAHVRVGDDIIRSRVRGRMRLGTRSPTNPVAVGDIVSLQVGRDRTGYITRVHERTNMLRRRAAGRRVGHTQVVVSNIDVVWIVQSVKLPKTNTGFIDRVLVAAESQDIMACIIFNKMDLADAAEDVHIDMLRLRYAQIGYGVYLTSALRNEGIERVREFMVDRVSIFFGPSGVGKSTLLNAIEPGLGLRTGSVSHRTRKGRHVTSFAELFPLTGGGSVVDTPGVREFGVLGLEPWELSHHFPEFRPFLNQCRFPACTHDHEPGCRVKEACSRKKVTPERYRSYLNILSSIHEGVADVGR